MSEIGKVTDALEGLSEARNLIASLNFPSTDELGEIRDEILYQVDSIGSSLVIWKTILILCEGFDLDVNEEAEAFSEHEKNG